MSLSAAPVTGNSSADTSTGAPAPGEAVPTTVVVEQPASSMPTASVGSVRRRTCLMRAFTLSAGRPDLRPARSGAGTECLVRPCPGGIQRAEPPDRAPPRRSALVQEPDGAQRGSGDGRRERLPVPGFLDRLDAAEVADARAAVALEVGVEDLPPLPAARQSDPVLVVRAAGEVGHAGQRRS